MKEMDSNVPVILSSGFNEVEAVRRFTGKGLAGFIQKPYTARTLAEKLAGIREPGASLQPAHSQSGPTKRRGDREPRKSD
jgi:FixJ family two-component response regulator